MVPASIRDQPRRNAPPAPPPKPLPPPPLPPHQSESSSGIDPGLLVPERLSSRAAGEAATAASAREAAGVTTGVEVNLIALYSNENILYYKNPKLSNLVLVLKFTHYVNYIWGM